MARRREKEKEEIDNRDRRQRGTRRGGYKEERIEIRVSRHVFIRREAVTGFYVFIYLSSRAVYTMKRVYIDGEVHISNLHGGESFGGFWQIFLSFNPFVCFLSLFLSFSLCLSRSAAFFFFFSPLDKKFATTGPPENTIGCRLKSTKNPLGISLITINVSHIVARTRDLFFEIDVVTVTTIHFFIALLIN